MQLGNILDNILPVSYIERSVDGELGECKDFWDKMLIQINILQNCVDKLEYRLKTINDKSEFKIVRRFFDDELILDEYNILYDFEKGHLQTKDIRMKCIIKFNRTYETIFELIDLAENKFDSENQQTVKQLYQLKTRLTDKQRGLLYLLLVENNFIPKETDQEGFIWAFGKENSKYTSFKIKWLKKNNLAVYMIDKLCYDPASTIPIWEIGSKLFAIKNMAQIKDGYLNNKNRTGPVSSELIDKIIDTVKGAK